MKKKIFIAGQEGMVGNAIHKLIKKKKLFKIIECNRKDLDLTNQVSVDKWFKKNRPEIVINAAGKVGGILDNSNYQSDYLYINSMIGFNLINSSLKYNVKKLINMGSACIYPKITKQPIREDQLMSSKLEKSNEGYAIAKIACLKYCEFIKKKYKKDFISVQPANLYGEGDNFDLKSSHVLPALVKKFSIAKKRKLKTVEIWGSGNQKREFLNVEDLASAISFLLKKNIDQSFINIGSGEEVSIKNLALSIKKVIGYNGDIIFNKDYPDGVKRRKVSTANLDSLGWKAKIKLKKGLKSYCDYYLKKVYPREN
jgi:GDP-L-fucose synthase